MLNIIRPNKKFLIQQNAMNHQIKIKAESIALQKSISLFSVTDYDIPFHLNT